MIDEIHTSCADKNLVEKATTHFEVVVKLKNMAAFKIKELFARVKNNESTTN